MPHVTRTTVDDREVEVLTFLEPDEVARTGLSREAIVGTIEPGATLSPETLSVNDAFLGFLHGSVARLGPELPVLRAAALKQGSGWLYVLDMRTPAGAEVSMDDLIGAFEVQAGRIGEGAYRANPGWRPVSTGGTFRFPSWLRELLRGALPRNS